MEGKPEEEGIIAPELALLKGGFPDLGKMKKEEMAKECQMWRDIWNWVPDTVRYYVARTLSPVEPTNSTHIPPFSLSRGDIPAWT